MASPLFRGAVALIEQSNSPRWVFGESVSCHRVLRGPYNLCLASAPGRGAIGVGTTAGLFVLESRVEREKGGIGRLEIDYGPFGQAVENVPLPPDEEAIEGDVVEFALSRHPLYENLPQDLLHEIDVALESIDETKYAEAYGNIFTHAMSATALDLLELRRKGVTHYVQYPPTYKRQSYSWDPPVTSGGGYIETPVPVRIRLPQGFDWLREADRVNFNGTFWQLSSVWRGGKNTITKLYPPT